MTENLTEIVEEHETEHSKFSPSGSGRWLECPGSIQLEEQVPKQPTSTYAAEGSAAHEVAAHCLRTSSLAVSMLGQVVLGFDVDRDMVTAVQAYLSYVQSFRTFESIFQVEKRVDLSFISNGMKGTLDCSIVNPTELHVFDYKHGKGVPVEVIDDKGDPNTQLSLYAIGELQKIFKLHKTLSHIENVYLHIVQPRCPHRDGPTRCVVTSVDWLKVFNNTVKDKIANACSNDPDYNPGEHQCRWCPAAAICKPLAEFNLNLARIEFSHLATGDVSTPNPNTLTAEDHGIIQKHMKMFETWLKACNTHCLNELKHGRKIPQRKLVRGRANRIWKDQDKALIYLRDNLEVDDEELWKKKFVSPAQAEGLIGRKKHDDIKFLWEKPKGNLSIAHIDDPRPSEEPTDDAVRDFAAYIGN